MKLTDRQKKEIIADRVTGMSFRAVAKKYGVSTTTVQRVVNGNPDVTRLVTQKKEQNTGGGNNELLQSLYDLEVRQNGLCTDAK